MRQKYRKQNTKAGLGSWSRKEPLKQKPGAGSGTGAAPTKNTG